MDAALRAAERPYASDPLTSLLLAGYAVDVRPDGPWVRATARGAGTPAGGVGLTYRAAPTAPEALAALADVVLAK